MKNVLLHWFRCCVLFVGLAVWAAPALGQNSGVTGQVAVVFNANSTVAGAALATTLLGKTVASNSQPQCGVYMVGFGNYMAGTGVVQVSGADILVNLIVAPSENMSTIWVSINGVEYTCVPYNSTIWAPGGSFVLQSGLGPGQAGTVPPIMFSVQWWAERSGSSSATRPSSTTQPTTSPSVPSTQAAKDKFSAVGRTAYDKMSAKLDDLGFNAHRKVGTGLITDPTVAKGKLDDIMGSFGITPTWSTGPFLAAVFDAAHVDGVPELIFLAVSIPHNLATDYAASVAVVRVFGTLIVCTVLMGRISSQLAWGLGMRDPQIFEDVWGALAGWLPFNNADDGEEEMPEVDYGGVEDDLVHASRVAEIRGDEEADPDFADLQKASARAEVEGHAEADADREQRLEFADYLLHGERGE